MPTNAQLDVPISFPDWSARLAETGMDESTRKSFEITIRWYLSFCKRSRVRATKRTAREFIEMAREEKGATEAVLESWREGIRWFFREGRAEMRREAEDGGSDGHRPTLQAERDIVLDVSVPSVEADSKGEEFEPKKPRGSAALPCGGWRAAMIRVLRIRKYAYRTEQSYLHWANRFARMRERQGRAVEDCGDGEIRAFLDELAVKGEVSAGTQRQAKKGSKKGSVPGKRTSLKRRALISEKVGSGQQESLRKGGNRSPGKRNFEANDA